MIIAREHTGRGVDDNETPAAALPEMPGEEHAIRAPELQRLRHWARDIRSVRFIVVAGHRVLHGASHIDLSKLRSEEHTSELQSLMRISYAVFCLKKKIQIHKRKDKRRIIRNQKN